MPEQLASIFTSAASLLESAECDGAPRICGPFAAVVRGTNVRGEHFETETDLDDLSASDCNLRLKQQLEQKAKLFVVARLHKALVAMHCAVLKAEPQENGLWCLSLGIIHHRFLTLTHGRNQSLLLSERPCEQRHDSKVSS